MYALVQKIFRQQSASIPSQNKLAVITMLSRDGKKPAAFDCGMLKLDCWMMKRGEQMGHALPSGAAASCQSGKNVHSETRSCAFKQEQNRNGALQCHHLMQT